MGSLEIAWGQLLNCMVVTTYFLLLLPIPESLDTNLTMLFGHIHYKFKWYIRDDYFLNHKVISFSTVSIGNHIDESVILGKRLHL